MSESDPSLLWLVVNLDRSPERLAAMAVRLDGLGLAWTRVPAIDGRATALPLPGIDPALYRRTHGREIQMDEVGCYLSHMRALDAFLASDAAHAMILEDDAVVMPAAVGIARALVAPDAPRDWDVVRFEAHHGRGGLAIRPLPDGTRLCALPFRAAGSAAYLVTRKGAEALLAGLLPMRVPYDHAFDRGWDFGLRVRAVLPLPVAAPRDGSTISRAGNLGRKRPSQRFRLATRVSRFVAACAARIAPARRPRRRAPASGPGFGEVEAALARRRDTVMPTGLTSAPLAGMAPQDEGSR